MSDAVAAPAKAAPKAKKTVAPKKPATHPKYSEMLQAAIGSLKERGGSSRQAILKYILANYNVGKDEKTVNNHLKLALRAGGKNGSLKQTKGTGASGSFRLGEVKKAAAKPKKATKPKAAKPKKVKTPKKAVAKPKKAKTPKKKAAAAKPKKVAAAKPMKANTPKKAAAKPKKAPAKKAAKPKKAAAKKV